MKEDHDGLLAFLERGDAFLEFEDVAAQWDGDAGGVGAATGELALGCCLLGILEGVEGKNGWCGYLDVEAGGEGFVASGGDEDGADGRGFMEPFYDLRKVYPHSRGNRSISSIRHVAEVLGVNKLTNFFVERGD